jgi:hypothetical protein
LGFFRILMSHRSAVTFDTFCLIIFISCVLSFRLSPRFVCLFLFMFSLLFSVSNFYFTSQYHQRLLFHSSLSNLYNNVIIYKILKSRQNSFVCERNVQNCPIHVIRALYILTCPCN